MPGICDPQAGDQHCLMRAVSVLRLDSEREGVAADMNCKKKAFDAVCM